MLFSVDEFFNRRRQIEDDLQRLMVEFAESRKGTDLASDPFVGFRPIEEVVLERAGLKLPAPSQGN